MKPPFLLVLGALLFESGAFAQAPSSPTPNTSTPLVNSADLSEIKAIHALMSIDALWKKSLDWNESQSSTADIVTHIKKALGTEAPPIEVRGKDTNRSTFVLKAAPLGPTLSSVAALANFQVWAFPGRLVVAPESALTPAERDLIQADMGGEWKRRTRWSAVQQLERATLDIVGPEIKARLAAKGVTIPAAPSAPPVASPAGTGPRVTTFNSANAAPMPYQLPLVELSPTTQGLLHELLDVRARMFNMPKAMIPTLDESVIVGFDDTQNSQMQLRLRKSGGTGAAPPLLENWYVQRKSPAKTQ